MNATNFPAHISAAVAAEVAQRGEPTPCFPSDNGFFYRFADGALLAITYNFKVMQWECAVRG